MPGLPMLTVLLPLLAASVLAAVQRRDWGEWINCGAAALGVLLALALPFVVDAPEGWLVAGPIARHMVLLNAIVGLAASWTSRHSAPPGGLRRYHALFQILLASANLAVLADNAMLTWAALQAGVLALGLATDDGRSPGGVLHLAGAALTLAAFGTLLLYLAAIPALGSGWQALSWAALTPASARCDGGVLSLAFVLLLIGYGGLAGLMPLQGWLLEAQSAPSLLGGVLGGLLPGAALAVILRLRGVLDGNAQAVTPGGPIMALGLVALVLAGVGLWRAQDGRRWLALSTVGQNGLIAFAFGLGGVSATLAGLLHLTAHGLTKAAAFQAMATRPSRPARLALAAAMAALAGLPPLGLFGSLMLIVQQAAQHAILLGLAVAIGIGVTSCAVILRRPRLEDAEPPDWAGTAGAWMCLAAAVALGLALPAGALAWFQAMAAGAR